MSEYIVYISRIQRKYAMTIGITRSLGSINYLVTSSEPSDYETATRLKEALELEFKKFRSENGYFFTKRRDIQLTKTLKRLQSPSPVVECET